MRIASPPIKHPCYMGINMPTKKELIANKMSLEELEAHVGQLLCHKYGDILLFKP